MGPIGGGVSYPWATTDSTKVHFGEVFHVGLVSTEARAWYLGVDTSQ